MRLLYHLIRWTLTLGFSAFFIALLSIAGVYSYYTPQIPSIEVLRDVRFQVPLKVYTRDHELIAEFGEKRRSPVAYADVPPILIKAFLAAEDDRFFEHPGVDYQGIIRAVSQLALTGQKTQGGSTITMQVARNFFLSKEKTYERKIKEILLALKIERALSKEEIFELYLNKIYLGKRAYGVGAAAAVYYGSTLDNLNIAQIAMIAGLPKAPSRFNPIADPKRSIIRRNYVLNRMLQLNFIDNTTYETGKNAPITAQVHTPMVTIKAPHIAEMVRAQMVKTFGEATYTNGYNVITTVDQRSQSIANKALRQALEEYDRRHGYRGPITRLRGISNMSTDIMDTALSKYIPIGPMIPGIIVHTEAHQAQVYLGNRTTIKLDMEAVSWASSYINENERGNKPTRVSDVIAQDDIIYVQRTIDNKWKLSQPPKVSGALIVLNPKDGAILSLVGSYDFHQSKFNRAVQSKRQPGSSFKPVLYAAALESGFTPATVINDAPITFEDAAMQKGVWRPENYSSKFFGPTRLRKALYKSRNLVSIRLLDAIGVPTVRSMAQRFGFTLEEVPNNLTVALGSGTTTPLRMASTYAIFSNGGFKVKPYLIDEIRTVNDKIILKASPEIVCHTCQPDTKVNTQPAINTALIEPMKQYVKIKNMNTEGPQQIRLAERVLSPQVHYQMTSMLMDVIKRGTGRKARKLGRDDLAGKTGTTNEQRDAWFNGFNPDLVVTTWVGFDDQTSLGKKETGGRAALPMWINFMSEALKGKPQHELLQPDGIVTIKIDPTTGFAIKSGQQGGVFETFRKELVPTTAVNESTSALRAQSPSGDDADIRESLF